MKCIEFKNWLVSRDALETKFDPAAMAHQKNCLSCRDLYNKDRELEGMIQNEFFSEEIPPGVIHRIETDLQKKDTRNIFADFRLGKFIPALSISLLALFFLFSFQSNEFKNLQHISKLSVQHHLKSDYGMTFNEKGIYAGIEMLNRELGFKVIIPNLSTKGYQLIGGRKCTLGKRDVAYIFYEKQGQINSLFILNFEDLGFEMANGGVYKDVNRGCDINIWKENGQVYAMVN